MTKGPISLQPSVLSLLSCPFIHPVNTPQVLHNTHSLLTAGKVNTTRKKLEKIQQEMDLMKYLLEDIATTHPLQLSQERERFKIWELYDRTTIMSLTQEDPVEVENTMWEKQFDWLVHKVMNLINKADGMAYNLRKIHSCYWRWENGGLKFIINLEVQTFNNGKELGRSKYFQALLERRVFLLGKQSLQTTDKKLTIVVIASELYSNELQNFLTLIKKLNTRVLPSLTILVVRMGHKETNSPTEIDKILIEFTNIFDILVVSTPQWLCRDHGISIALQQVRPSDMLFLADLDLQFDHVFLTRCSLYPQIGKQVYFPYPLVEYGENVRSFISQLPSLSENHYNAYWIYTSGLMCIYAADLISAVLQDDNGIPQEVHTQSIGGNLVRKGYRVLRGPDDNLWWILKDKDCGRVLVGEPCENEVGEKENKENEELASVHLSYHLLQQMIN